MAGAEGSPLEEAKTIRPPNHRQRGTRPVGRRGARRISALVHESQRQQHDDDRERTFMKNTARQLM
jgi:hypothetical protein